MKSLDPMVSAHYAEFKKTWDVLTEATKQSIDEVIPNSPSNDPIFNLAYTMGFNTALEHTLSLLIVSLSNDPGNKEVQALKDLVSWVAIRLFLIEYEKTLLENSSSETLH